MSASTRTPLPPELLARAITIEIDLQDDNREVLYLAVRAGAIVRSLAVLSYAGWSSGVGSGGTQATIGVQGYDLPTNGSGVGGLLVTALGSRGPTRVRLNVLVDGLAPGDVLAIDRDLPPSTWPHRISITRMDASGSVTWSQTPLANHIALTYPWAASP